MQFFVLYRSIVGGDVKLGKVACDRMTVPHLPFLVSLSVLSQGLVGAAAESGLLAVRVVSIGRKQQSGLLASAYSSLFRVVSIGREQNIG